MVNSAERNQFAAGILAAWGPSWQLIDHFWMSLCINLWLCCFLISTMVSIRIPSRMKYVCITTACITTTRKPAHYICSIPKTHLFRLSFYSPSLLPILSFDVTLPSSQICHHSTGVLRAQLRKHETPRF